MIKSDDKDGPSYGTKRLTPGILVVYDYAELMPSTFIVHFDSTPSQKEAPGDSPPRSATSSNTTVTTSYILIYAR